jgi:enoyl-CoA hydratase/carnithine racemase
MTGSEAVLTERLDAILVVRLNRPEARNALNLAVLDALAEALASSANDAGIVSLVLGTTRPAAFSAGMDKKEAQLAGQQTSTILSEVLWMLALAADIRVGDAATQFRFPGARYGLVQGSWHLLDTVGASWARQIVLTGRAVEAEEALRLGLIHEISPDAEARAVEVAAELREGSALAMAETKRLILEAGDKTLKERFDEETRITEELMQTTEVAGRLRGGNR